MTGLLIELLLGLAVLAAWIGCLAALRLPTSLDRLHAVAFINAGTGLPLAAATLLADGFSGRALKVILLVGVSIGTGAVLAHATGRAIVLRGGDTR